MTEATVTHGGQALQGQATEASPIRAYQDLVVGSHSIRALLYYEICAAWISPVPGALGLLLRKWLWPSLLGRSGRRIVWGRSIVIRHPAKMWIGDGVIIDDDCCLDAKGCATGEFEIGERTLVSRGCVLSAKDGSLTIGPRVNLGARCILYASTKLEIGADTMLAADCYIGGGRYNARGRLDIPISRQQLPRSGTVIGEDCWIGAGAVVVDGVRIGRGSVVGAGAVVTRSLPDYSIAAGIPARIIGSRQAEPVQAGS
jgi:carbonic anhydrase/acetyltransferase-like protein (isoleucine patch superfamily)